MLKPLTITYVGDSANILHDMLVTLPRFGHKLRVATPPQYGCPEPVWARVKELGCDVEGAQLESGLPGIPNGGIWWGADPKEAVNGADVVVTDTWCGSPLLQRLWSARILLTSIIL